MQRERGAGSVEHRRRARIARGEAFTPPPLVEPAEIFCPIERFIGRAHIILSGGPMVLADFVRAMRRPEPEVVERATELRAIAEAMQSGGTWVAYLKTESWERLHAFRATSFGEMRHAA